MDRTVARYRLTIVANVMIIMIIHMQVYSKPKSDQECEKEYEKFALHVKIRYKDCSLSDEILAMEEKFER